MKIQSNVIEWLLENKLSIRGNNTKICIAYWKIIAKKRGIEFSSDIEKIIMDYKPESITRKRRDLVESSKEQIDKAMNFYNNYSGRENHEGI